MKFTTRVIGGTIIELKVTNHNGTAEIEEDITDMNGEVPAEFIEELRELADDLELHNHNLR
jgi:hypothetical protein